MSVDNVNYQLSLQNVKEEIDRLPSQILTLREARIAKVVKGKLNLAVQELSKSIALANKAVAQASEQDIDLGL